MCVCVSISEVSLRVSEKEKEREKDTKVSPLMSNPLVVAIPVRNSDEELAPALNHVHLQVCSFLFSSPVENDLRRRVLFLLPCFVGSFVCVCVCVCVGYRPCAFVLFAFVCAWSVWYRMAVGWRGCGGGGGAKFRTE